MNNILELPITSSGGGSVTVGEGLLEGIHYDDIEASYPTTSTESYNYLLMTTVQATILVTYSDSTKKILISAKRV